MAKSVILGALKTIRTMDGYKDHHPTIINSTNGDVIAYYYDYWVYSWGILIFTMEAQASIGNTYYGLRFMKYDSISSISLDDPIAEKLDWSAIAGIETSESDWNNLVTSVLSECKSGVSNGGLEYRSLQFDCGNWFDITHIIDIKDGILQYKSNYIDVSGIGIVDRRIITDVSTICQFSLPVKDYFRLDSIRNIVVSEQEILTGINKSLVFVGKRLYSPWASPVDYSVEQHSYLYGDIVSRRDPNTGDKKYFISSIDNNPYDPLKAPEYWKKINVTFGGD